MSNMRGGASRGRGLDFAARSTRVTPAPRVSIGARSQHAVRARVSRGFGSGTHALHGNQPELRRVHGSGVDVRRGDHGDRRETRCLVGRRLRLWVAPTVNAFGSIIWTWKIALDSDSPVVSRNRAPLNSLPRDFGHSPTVNHHA